jgi:hypothetical protein
MSFGVWQRLRRIVLMMRRVDHLGPIPYLQGAFRHLVDLA